MEILIKVLDKLSKQKHRDNLNYFVINTSKIKLAFSSSASSANNFFSPLTNSIKHFISIEFDEKLFMASTFI